MRTINQLFTRTSKAIALLARLEGYGKSIVGTAGNDTIQIDYAAELI